MRKVILSMMVSLDGFIEGPNREIDWQVVHEEFDQYASCVCVPLVVIGIAIQIMSTTSGAVFSASIISSSHSNNANTVISGIIGGIIAIAINVVVLYYLYRPNVKAYFGNAHPPEIK